MVADMYSLIHSIMYPLVGTSWVALFWCICAFVGIVGFGIFVLGMITQNAGVITIGCVLMAMWCAGTIAINYLEGEHDKARTYSIVPAYVYNSSTHQEIVSLGSDTEYTMSGSGKYRTAFTIGSGSMTINGNTFPVYVYYKKLGDRSYMRDQIPSTGVFINEDNETQPNIEIVTQHTTSEKHIYDDNGEVRGGVESSSVIKTIIHVPEGTIVKELNLVAGQGGM